MIPTRKNCKKCTRWRQAIDFSPIRWMDKAKTVVKELMTICKSCVRQYQRNYYANLSSQRKEIRLTSKRAYERRKRRAAGVAERGPYRLALSKNDSVRREPFADWIIEKINTGITWNRLVEETGVAERLLRSYVRGYDKTGKRVNSNKHKLRTIDWISFSTVDSALAKFGEGYRLNELYPLEETDL